VTVLIDTGPDTFIWIATRALLRYLDIFPTGVIVINVIIMFIGLVITGEVSVKPETFFKIIPEITHVVLLRIVSRPTRAVGP
jgi:hypothetical protein